MCSPAPVAPGARADRADADRDVVEVSRLEPGQEADLRARLDLEQADGVALADAVVDALVVAEAVQARRSPPRASSCSNTREITLSIPSPSRSILIRLTPNCSASDGQIVLVPGDDGALRHPGWLAVDDFVERARRDRPCRRRGSRGGAARRSTAGIELDQPGWRAARRSGRPTRRPSRVSSECTVVQSTVLARVSIWCWGSPSANATSRMALRPR